MKYNYNRPKTEAEIERNRKESDWNKRLDVLILRNQGWTFEQIGKKYGITKVAVRQMYERIKHMTIEEVEKLKNIYS